MKKNNEGYVLAMVMVVIAVLAVVASAMLSVALQNVNTQKAAVMRMQERYTAEGKVEKILAGMTVLKGEEPQNQLNEAGKELEAIITNYLDGYNTDNEKPSPAEHNKDGIITSCEWDSSEKNCKFTIKVEHESVIIEAELELEYKVGQSNSSSPFVATIDSIEYTSYKISTTTEGGAIE